MGDGHRGCAHFHDNFADQIVDHTCHNWVETCGGFVEENNLGVGGDGARKPYALLHAAGQLGRKPVCDIRFEADAAQLFNCQRTGFVG